MPSYQNYSSDSKFIPKEMLNNNRVLTMSNNRKCNYLIVDVSVSTENNKDITTMMGINTQGNTKDILILKTFIGKSFQELVDEAYWLCCEFGIQIILADKNGFGISFIETFEANINPSHIQVRALDGNKINQMLNMKDIINDLKNGILRFLQKPELARNTYIKPFLGLANIMEYHKETSILINEINNLEVKMRLGNIVLDRLDETIGKSRVNCLLMFYSYPMSEVLNEKIEFEDIKDKYDITKRISQYEIVHGTFYKYMFKGIENNGIKVLFYYNEKHKIKQFQNIVQEEQFKILFFKHIKNVIVCKDSLEIRFHNNSYIKFVFAGEGSRGNRCHYIVVDTEIKKDIYYDVILPTCVLFEIDKENKKLKDIYNVEFIEM